MIQPGIYAFTNSAVHYIAGKAYSGSMIVTEMLARDPYVGRLVVGGAMKYVGAAPDEAPRSSAPKLIDRSAPEAPKPEEKPADRPFQQSAKSKDKK